MFDQPIDLPLLLAEYEADPVTVVRAVTRLVLTCAKLAIPLADHTREKPWREIVILIGEIVDRLEAIAGKSGAPLLPPPEDSCPQSSPGPRPLRSV